MSETLSRIQARLRPRLDEILPRLTGTHLSSTELALQFSREIREGSRKDAQGSRFAPDQYTLTLSPKDITAAEKTVGAVQEELSQTLGEALRESGFALQRTPHVTVATDPTLRRGQVRLIAWHSRDPLQVTDTVASPDGSATSIPGGAFLIVEGRRHFPLTTEIVKIGRSTDNDLLLGDPHVSRKHAELRAQGGRYVVYDLDSTAGTRVNGELSPNENLGTGRRDHAGRGRAGVRGRPAGSAGRHGRLSPSFSASLRCHDDHPSGSADLDGSGAANRAAERRLRQAQEALEGPGRCSIRPLRRG